MTTTKRRLTFGDKLYFSQFALIGAAVVTAVLTYFGLPSIFVLLAAAALTTVSFARGRLEKDYSTAVISLVPLAFAVVLAVLPFLG